MQQILLLSTVHCIYPCMYMLWWPMPSKHAKTAQRKRRRKALNVVHPDQSSKRGGARMPNKNKRVLPRASSPTDGPSTLTIDTHRAMSANVPRPPTPPNPRDRSHHRREDVRGSRPHNACVEAKQLARRGHVFDWQRARREARDRKRGPLELDLCVE